MKENSNSPSVDTWIATGRMDGCHNDVASEETSPSSSVEPHPPPVVDMSPLKKQKSGKRGGKPGMWHPEIVPRRYMELKRAGYSEGEICRIFGVSEGHFERWFRYAEMRAAIVELDKDGIRKLTPAEEEKKKEESLTYEEKLEIGVTEAIDALRRVVRYGKTDNAVVSAANAVLDRAKGKPVQTTHIDQRVSYNIVSAIPAPPNSGLITDVIEGESEKVDIVKEIDWGDE